jgi:hypothetical protein
MRRSAVQARHLAAVFAFALIAAGCASPSASAPQTTPKSDGPASVSPSTPTPKLSSPAQKLTSPFASLASYVAGRPGVVTAAVLDRTTGHMWILHPGVKEDTGSIVKVEIMATALRQAQTAGSEPPGSEQGLMTTMIENSNNDAATQLLHEVGGPAAVQSFDNSIGMSGTTVSTLAFIPGSTTLPGWGLTTTTARDEVRLVSKFAFRNSTLNTADRNYGLNLMEHVESDQAWGVSAGVEPGATVALKNGWLPLDLANYTNWQIDSIGWIHGNGRNYVLAVLSNGNPTEGDGITTIDHIASVIYAELGPAG